MIVQNHSEIFHRNFVAAFHQTFEFSSVNNFSVLEQTLTHPLQDLTLENGSSVSDMSNSLILDEGTDASLGNPLEREVNPSPTQPKTLQQEFSLINLNMPNVQMDVVRLSSLHC